MIQQFGLKDPPSASMGVDGSDSGSGAFDMMVKSNPAKKSMGVDVYVVRGLRCYDSLRVDLSLYTSSF
jgi:hypothetical protein